MCIRLGCLIRDVEVISIFRCEEVRGESRVNEIFRESLGIREGCLMGVGDGGRGM